MALDPNITNAIAEGQRFLQLMHGVDWLTTLCQTAVDADKLVAERQLMLDAVNADLAEATAYHDAKLAQFENEFASAKTQYDLSMASLSAELKTAQDNLANIVAMRAAASTQRDQEAKDAASAQRDVLAGYAAEIDAKKQELADLNDAVSALHSKIAAIKG